jgi:hypothetical protein
VRRTFKAKAIRKSDGAIRDVDGWYDPATGVVTYKMTGEPEFGTWYISGEIKLDIEWQEIDEKEKQ